jgi:mycothiol synthase
MLATSHPYRGLEDMQRMRELLVATRARTGHGCWHVGDLVWRLFLHSIRYDLGRMVRLWEDANGNLVGFAVVSPPTAKGTVCFDLQVHPQERGRGSEEQMLDWVEAWGHEAIARMPDAPPLRLATDTGVYDDDAGQIAALECCGFVHCGPDGVLLLRRLDEFIPTPVLPVGFVVRSVAGPHEIRERPSAHRDAFGSSRITGDAYLRLMNMPGYSPELDIVAVAPDGTFAAFCIGWYDEVNRAGEFEPVGTRPAFRRLGLARAVLLEGLQRLKAQGADGVVVGPISVEDDAAVQLYRSIGFRTIHQVLSYAEEHRIRSDCRSD